ncbi:uncharacterized protein [Hyperolius riggenbachi]
MTASNSFNTTSETNVAEVTQETVTPMNNETHEIIIEVMGTSSETKIVSSEIVHGEDQFQIKIAATQEKICNTYCEGPELRLWMIALLRVDYTKKYRTYNYLTTIKGQTLGLNISLVGGVNVYLQEPESTANTTNMASVNVVCFYNSTYGLPPQVRLVTNDSSTLKIDTFVPPTVVSTPSLTSVYTHAPNVPSYICMDVRVALPGTLIQKSFIVLPPPITLNRGGHQMTVTAKKIAQFNYFNNILIPYPEPELDIQFSAKINNKASIGCHLTVTGGQTLGLNIDLTNGLKIYPQNPEFTASGTGSASVNINFIYNPRNGLPSFTKKYPDNPREVSLKVETSVFAHSGGAFSLGHSLLKIMFLLFCCFLPSH